MVLPGGRLLSAIPQRCICRQSYFGNAFSVGGVLISPAFSPPRTRRATAAANSLPSFTDCIEPPRSPSPKKTSRKEKVGALAEEVRRFSAAFCSCVTPAASTFIKCQKMAVGGAKFALFFKMASELSLKSGDGRERGG